MTKKKLPEELEGLQHQYRELVRAVERGDLREEDAFEALAHITCADSSGAVWSMDGDGRFLRRPNPFEPAEPAEPATFARRQSPVEESAIDGPMPGGRFKASPTKGVKVPVREKSLSDSGRGRERSGYIPGPAWLKTPTAVVSVVALVLLVLAVTLRPTSPTGVATDPTAALSTSVAPTADGAVPTAPIPSEVTATTAGPLTDPATGPSSESSTPLGDADEGTQAQRMAPSLDQVTLTISVLSEGSLGDIVDMVVDPGPVWRRVTGASTFRGLAPLGWSLQPGPFSLAASTVEQYWFVVDDTTGENLDRWRVRWVSEQGSWKLATWPSPAPQ